MHITVTDYLDVVSSWCFWSEPTWAELKKRYEGRVKFEWKIALMDPNGLPASREQEQWFYRRSGMIMRSPFMLNTDWYDSSLPEWLAPNSVAEAAKDFGFTDDRAVFSGVVKLEPLTATIDSMLDDAAAYAAHKAHFGDPPPK